MIQTIAKKNKGCEKEEYIPGHRQREIPDRLNFDSKPARPIPVKRSLRYARKKHKKRWYRETFALCT